ncbi:MAG: hypothetical protein H6738_09300 [Alphaproteobacteria bacterium]|nr:hypothetical protein [Alphaproteobacteria bacterium]
MFLTSLVFALAARAEEPQPEPAPEAEPANGEEQAPAAEAPPAPAPAPSPPVTVAPPPPPPPANMGPEEVLTMPSLTLDRVPPRQSYDLALQISYGQVAYFRDAVPPWIGFGIRGAWGRNMGLNRIGAAALVAAEGDIGVHTYLSLEPSLAWDFVSQGKKGGIQLGANIGPALGYVVHNETVVTERSFEVAPAAAVRIGWSQGWTRVGRRLFAVVEPKVRYADDGLSAVVALVIGSGGGR